MIGVLDRHFDPMIVKHERRAEVARRSAIVDQVSINF